MYQIRSFITQFVQSQTGCDIHSIQVDLPFDHYGLTSSQLIALVQALEQEMKKPLPLTLAWEYPSIEALSRYLSSEYPELKGRVSPSEDENNPASQEDIAIVGMSCRFPKAKNLEAFWDLCVEGIDAITEVPSERWELAGLYDPDPLAKGKIYSKWGGFLDHLDQFDASFFGISPREAVHLDPRQRLILETSWEALQDARIMPQHLKGSNAGVFIATLSDDYGKLIFPHLELIETYSGSGNAHSMVANRISYFYDFHGPSLAVDTACSGSLVALHLASHSLKSKECNIALVGGVNLLLTPDSSIFFSRAQALSKTGRCKTFDATADGFVRSEGAGIIVLKRLSDALSEGHRIYAVIKGSAINQDGRTNGTMAPNPKAQEAVLREAYKRARISASQVQYIELHGTGTKIGDSIEAQALAIVLKEGRLSSSKCLIGSVKTNIGHTEAAAGVAGVIKTALSIFHKKLPKSLHFKNLNPLISSESPFTFITSSESWPTPSQELIAGVSSFGFGGTNGHVVLSSPPTTSQVNLLPPLPTTTWNKKSFWIESQKSRTNHLLGSYINPIKIPTLHVWIVNIPKDYLFNDHQIGNEIVFPGSGYLELALEAAYFGLGPKRSRYKSVNIKNIQFLRKLKLQNNADIQLSLTEEPLETQFEVHSSKEIFAKGFITFSTPSPPNRNPEMILSLCPRILAAKDHYRAMSKQGLNYGPSFQALHDIHVGASLAIARIECPAVHGWTICIDSLFQLTATLTSTGGLQEMRLPVEAKTFECFGSLNIPWVYGYVFSENENDSFHLELLDPTGIVLAKVTSLRLLPVANTPPPSIYSLSWEKASSSQPSYIRESQSHWLIFGGKNNLSDALITLLTKSGSHVIQIEKSAHLSSFKQDLLLQKWNVIALMPEPFWEILMLTQLCIGSPIAPTLCFVTRGAQSIMGECLTLDSSYQGLVWGLGRAAMHVEHPALQGKLIDLDPMVEESYTEAHHILELWHYSEDQIAWRKGIRYQSRLRSVSMPSTPEMKFHPNSIYLITGGLGELGLSTAEWMCRQGAKHLILTGRNEVPDRSMWTSLDLQHPRFKAIQAILLLESQGCQIETYSLDTSHLPSLMNLLHERKSQNLSPIRGVIHTAGVVKDASILLVKEEHIQAILPSKVEGAVNLYTAFKNESLDFLVFFSSLAATLPIIGQGVYAAANAFLDAFVYFLRGQNINAFSIDWGPMQIGMTSSLQNKNLHATRGMFLMEPSLCWDILGAVLQKNFPFAVVAAADWPQVYRSRAYCPPMIQELAPSMSLSAKSENFAFSLLEQLKQSACSVLRIADTEIDSQKSLAQMGLDSLMAMELKNLVFVKLGIQVTISQLFQEISLEELAQNLQPRF